MQLAPCFFAPSCKAGGADAAKGDAGILDRLWDPSYKKQNAPICSVTDSEQMRAFAIKEENEGEWLVYLAAFSPSGKMILFTKKKITMEMPPLRTVVPML